jgi:hypothetical protein
VIGEDTGQSGKSDEGETVPDPVDGQHNAAVASNREGLDYYNRGEWEKAVERFREALENWPDNAEFKENLRKAEEKFQEKKDAEEKTAFHDNLIKGMDAAQEKTDFLNKLEDGFDRQDADVSRKNLEDAFEKQARAEKQALIEKKQKHIEALHQDVKNIQVNIRNLGLYGSRDPEKRAKDFEAWAEVSTRAKVDLEKEVLDACLVVAQKGLIESAAYGAKQVSKPVTTFLTPENVEARIRLLRKKGVTDPYFFSALRAYAKQPGKQELAQKVIDRLGKAADLVAASVNQPEGEEGSGTEALEALGAVLGFISPRYEILLSDLKFTAASIYNSAARWESSRQIDSLTKLTEDQLKRLKSLDARMRDDFQQIEKEKKELNQLISEE